MSISYEHSLQCAVADLLRLNAAPGVIWTHPPNGEARSARTGAKLKRMGVRAGAPDILIILPDGRAACLELKGPKGTLSAAQRVWREDCRRIGVPYDTASTLWEAQAILDAWGAIGKPATPLRMAVAA